MRRLLSRVLHSLGFGQDNDPPQSFVREPRRPHPPSRGGAATLELPQTDDAQDD
jgi:hypothetical protein